MVVQKPRRIKRGKKIHTVNGGGGMALAKFNAGKKIMGSHFITLNENMPNLEYINMEKDESNKEEQHVIVEDNSGILKR